MSTVSLESTLKKMDDEYFASAGSYAANANELFKLCAHDPVNFGDVTINSIKQYWPSLLQHRNPSSTIQHAGSLSDLHAVVWGWENDSGDFVDYPQPISNRLERAKLGEKVEYFVSNQEFILSKDTQTTGSQLNPSTKYKRNIRKQVPSGLLQATTNQQDKHVRIKSLGPSNMSAVALLHKSNNGGKVVWQFEDDDGSYKDCNSVVTDHLEGWQPGKYLLTVSSHTYDVEKLDDDNAVQTNIGTKKKRTLRRQVQQAVVPLALLWEWQENDTSFKSYDQKESLIIENANVGEKISLGSSYEVLKKTRTTGTQTNTQTGKDRFIRQKGTTSNNATSNSGATSNSVNNAHQPTKIPKKKSRADSTDSKDFDIENAIMNIQKQITELKENKDNEKDDIVWEWKENDGSYKPYSSDVIKKIEQANIGQKVSLTDPYVLIKKDQTSATQTNTKSNVTRECRRRVLTDATDSTEYQNLLDKVRRLETELNVLQDIVWEWQDDDGTWKVYTDKVFVKNLEETILNEPVSLNVKGVDNYVVKSDPNTGTQKDTATNKTRPVRRRKINKSKDDVELPPWWVPVPSNATSCFVKVPNIDTHELTKQAVQDFYKTVPNTTHEVVEAYIVQNLHIWVQHHSLEKTWLSTKRITQQTTNIRWMWHGSYSKTIPEICSKGFLRDYNSTHLFGKGVYFARDSKYPVNNGYSRFDDDKGYAHILYCRVICGESVLGKQDLVRPPNKPTTGGITLEYETLVDQVADPSIVVCCTDCQACPVLKLVIKKKV